MTKKNQQQSSHIVPRPPVVVVVGHIDHGKSTLLDYIRKSNVVESEAGGITQHLSAYVVEHTTSADEKKQLTFLDTPGHEAFQQMRLRGADVADVAILVVSAEDGVKPQTLEALASITAANIPYVIAINKIDKPAADIARTQASLIEHEIYPEGMGGDVPWVATSAATGEGIKELLDTVVLAAELRELQADTNAAASGTVIEAFCDKKRGNTATLIITNGTLKNGAVAVSGRAFAPVRIMEDVAGTRISEAGPSCPVQIVGWNTVPQVGDAFISVSSKKEAEALTKKPTPLPHAADNKKDSALPRVALVIKADVSGSIDAIEHELKKHTSDRLAVRIVATGVGDIGVNDVQNVGATEGAMIVGFHVRIEPAAAEQAQRLGVTVNTFDVIYELGQWLEQELDNRTPSKKEKHTTGRAKVLKAFSTQKHTHVLGARIEEGAVTVGTSVDILRRDVPVGNGTITNLQQEKSDVQTVTEGTFGVQLTSKNEIVPGDSISAFQMVVS